MTNVLEVIDAAGRAHELDINFDGSAWQVVEHGPKGRIVLAGQLGDHGAALAKLGELARELSARK